MIFEYSNNLYEFSMLETPQPSVRRTSINLSLGSTLLFILKGVRSVNRFYKL